MNLGLKELLSRCSGRRVFVIGDMMLDRVIRGDVERVSPEAPVPVLRHRWEEAIPGGACNVAHNMARLGCQAVMFGLLGQDPQGDELLGLLDHKGIRFSGVRCGRPTTTKTRVVAQRHQLLRVDREESRPLSPKEEADLLKAVEVEAAMGCPSVVVLSDYAKGVCSPGLCGKVISLFSSLGVPVLVDPKGIDWGRYRGASLITPNLKELGMALGRPVPNDDSAVEAAAKELMERFGLDMVMVTRSEMGLSLFGGPVPLHERSSAREVYDVTGAGDTVVAVLASLLAAGADMAVAAHWANRAAGYVVGKEGTYAIGAEELLSLADGLADKLVLDSFAEAAGVVERWRRSGDTVVFTNGCFDVLHPGHVRCLRAARSMGDRLVVGLNSDDSVRRLKGPGRPLNNHWMRAEVLAALDSVDLVVIFDQDTPLELIKELRPHVLVKGGDYREDQIVGASEVREWGGRVAVVPLLEGLSTTGIIERARRYCGDD
ncbi:D-heptose-1-phosphate adenylyltransferase [Thermanaerovibrio velox DSM 12556]|uniref:Bifunctional protein HldE n=1 Tax=Thermanaerovibrio velox DSM 12556 TaxID=926567 RepID=H0UN31_9BACT|nr:D-glycero-beta-D-manno-heptose 1-phosphate adenylyltransferase [Thermanaerovibrio velox]EHM09310.1 D-heptose-1-phosphate adenylyltransferase [Thermanaerovibrio velox DSM 12556]